MNPTDAVKTLIECQWTETAIAKRVGSTQANINRIKAGSEPRYELGLQIVALARRVAAQKARREKLNGTHDH
jgi:hypothetical protein